MGWTLPSDDGKQAVLDIGDLGSAMIRRFPREGPDGGDLQISNGNGLAKARKAAATAKLTAPLPFENDRVEDGVAGPFLVQRGERRSTPPRAMTG